jgi:hypothetical protein
MMKMSRLSIGVALLSALIVVASASASGTFSATIYGNTAYNCHGSDASGETHGTFTVTENTGDSWVNASITIRGSLYPNRTYNVSVIQGTGSYCTTTDPNLVSFTTDASGKTGPVHFQFYAHHGSTFAWITIQHSTTSDLYRSQTVPLGK